MGLQESNWTHRLALAAFGKPPRVLQWGRDAAAVAVPPLTQTWPCGWGSSRHSTAVQKSTKKSFQAQGIPFQKESNPAPHTKSQYLLGARALSLGCSQWLPPSSTGKTPCYLWSDRGQGGGGGEGGDTDLRPSLPGALPLDMAGSSTA